MSESRRPLVLLVGRPSRIGRDMACGLIDRGTSVVTCSGPPECPLLRDEPCVLARSADAVVVLPTASADRDVLAGLSLCAEDARTGIVMQPSAVAPPRRTIRVLATDVDRASRIVSSVLHHPSTRKRQTG